MYTRRQELICTENQMIAKPGVVLRDGEVIRIRMNNGQIYEKMGDGVTPIIDLPYNINSEFAERAEKAANEAAENAREEVETLVGELGVVQTTGDSPTAVMSQKATTELAEKITEHTDVTYSYDNPELCPFEGYMNAVTGTEKPSGSWRATDYIPVNEGTTIRGENVFGNAKATPVAFYDAYKNFISSVVFETDGFNALDVTPPANAKYARLSFFNSSSPISVETWVKALGEDKLVQGAGDSIDKVMSQKAVTDMVERFVDGECYILNEDKVKNEGIQGGKFGSSDIRITYKSPMVFDYDVEIRCESGYKFEVVTWQDTTLEPNSFIAGSGWKTNAYIVKAGTIFNLFIAKTDEGTINVSEYANVRLYRSGSISVEEVNLKVDNLADSVHHTTPIIRKELVVNETHNNGLFWFDNTRLAYKVPMLFNYDVEVRCESGYRFSVITWSDTTITQSNFVSSSGWREEPYVVRGGTIFTLLISKIDNSEISVSEYDNIKMYRTLDFGAEETPKQSDVLARNQTALQNLYAASKYDPRQDKRFTALITTDVHSDSARLRNAIEVLNGVEAIDCGFCLGDMQGGNYSESDGTRYTNIVNTSEKPFYTVLGNHDQMNYPCDMTGGTPTEAFNKFIQPTLSVLGQNITEPYYKVLYDTYKIAFICLNNFDAPTEQNADGTFIVRRDTECISAEQLAWFIEALNTIPADYHLIVARHSFPSGNQRIDHEWTQAWVLAGSVLVYSDNNIIPDIIDAWIKGASLSKTYAPMSGFELCPTHNVNVDFSSRGAGNFVCYLVGHSHRDLICTPTAYENQIIIGFCATTIDDGQDNTSDLPRVSGTRTQDAITAITVDTAARKIRLVRFGSDITFDLVKRDVTTINY